jgi:hypothetical protein
MEAVPHFQTPAYTSLISVLTVSLKFLNASDGSDKTILLIQPNFFVNSQSTLRKMPDLNPRSNAASIGTNMYT